MAKQWQWNQATPFYTIDVNVIYCPKFWIFLFYHHAQSGISWDLNTLCVISFSTFIKKKQQKRITIRKDKITLRALPCVPSKRPGISRNWRRTSWMIDWADLPTASMVKAEKTNGNNVPIKMPGTIYAARASTIAIKCCGSVIPVATKLISFSCTRCVNAVINAIDVNTAEPIAKPDY